MNQNEKALDALKAVADGSQLALDNPKWRLDEATCNLVRDALESQPVAGQVSVEAERAPIQSIVFSHTMDTLADLEAMINELVILFRTAQQPQAPAVEVPILDCRCMCEACEARTKETYNLTIKCFNCGWDAVALIRKGDGFPSAKDCPNCGNMRLYAITPKGAHS